MSFPLKYVQTDGGGEFKTLAPYFAHHGIANHLTCPHTSEQMELLKQNIDTLLKWD